MNRIVLSFLLLFIGTASAGVTLLEQSPGKLKIKVTADTLGVQTIDGVTRLVGNNIDLVKDKAGHSVPSYVFSLFLNDPKDAKISVAVKKQVKIPLTKPLSKNSTNSITLGSKYTSDIILSRFHNAPLYNVHITPVVDIKNSSVTQFTEAVVTVTYTPVKNTTEPKGDYYRSIATAALNPSEFNLIDTRTAQISPAQKRMLRSIAGGDNYFGTDEQAMKITIQPNDLTRTTAETDGSVDRMVRITPDMITQIGSNVNINEIAVFSSNPFAFDSVTPGVHEIPASLVPTSVIRMDKNSNGKFDNTDEILFFAQGANFWYESEDVWSFHFNKFCEYRNYYITVGTGAVQMPKVVQPTDPTVAKSSALNLMRLKKSTQITTPADPHAFASQDWLWQDIKPGIPSFTDIFTQFFNEDVTEESYIRINNPNGSRKLASSSSPKLTFSNGSETDLKYNTIDDIWYLMPPQTSSFKLTINNMSPKNYFDIGSYDLKYFHHLNMQGMKTLRFFSSSSRTGEDVITYEISNIPSELTSIIRVNSKLQTVELIDTLSAGGTYMFNDSVGPGYEYIISTASGILSDSPTLTTPTPGIPSEYWVRNLHEITNRSDYMIITPEEFITQGIGFAAHKKSTGRFQHPTVVTTEDIYREFSGGIPDPAAIRNFMVYARNLWNQESIIDYLLLLGTGHYDYKGIISDKPNYIFPYITGKGKDITCIEDFYAYLVEGRTAGNSNTLPSLAVGRVPGVTSTDIDAYLKKLQFMESGEGDFSEWRNVVTLVSDDDMVGGEEESLKHWAQSDRIGDTILILSDATRIKKITLFEYPFNGSKKPEAKIDMINTINDGTGVMNYFGHGGYNAMADERIFELSNITDLSNYRRYMIYLAFSCSVGFFDVPGQECISGKFVTTADKGAIASVSSTRTSYSSPNEAMAKKFYANFYDPSIVNTIGTSYVKSKNGGSNLLYYAIFGDPSYRPLSTNKKLTVDIQDMDGNSVDTMMALQRVRVLADVPAGHKIDSVRIHLENPEQTDVKRKDGGSNDTVKYRLPGSILLNQSYPVINNKIDNIITIPIPVVQRTEGTKLRIYGWCKDSPKTATGIKTGLYFDGLDESNLDTTDKSGPSIVIKLKQDENLADTTLPGAVGNKVVIDGFVADSTSYQPEPAVVELYFSDKSGIDIFGENAGQGITVSLKGIRTSKNHNGDFKAIGESPNKGKVTLSFNQSEFPVPGEYELIVTATDFLQNSTQERFILDVRSLGDGVYDIGDFYAYPSPAYTGEHTRFYFNTPTESVHKMSLKVFTLSGQLVRQFNDVQPGVRWDLKDQRGNKLSPNVYLYRLYVERDKRTDNTNFNSDEGKEIIQSKIRKMVIYPPR